MNREVIVVTAAYGSQKIAELGGQQALLAIIAAAGADGVEIRRELFTPDEVCQLDKLGEAITRSGLAAFYSVPEALFMPDGGLNPHLDQHFVEAEQLNARLLKYSLGHYRANCDYSELRCRLARQKIHLVVENDQTGCGTLAAMVRFFHASGENQICNGMTFDIGNWLWAGSPPLEAAERLAGYVSYIHVKAALPQGDSWRTVALNVGDDLWRQTLALLPNHPARAIEFPLEGSDLVAVTRHYVDLLREE